MKEELKDLAKQYADDNIEPLRPKDSLYAHFHATISAAFFAGHKESHKESIKMRDAYNNYITALANENFILRKKIAEIFDPTKNNSYVSKMNEVKEKLCEALKPFIQP